MSTVTFYKPGSLEGWFTKQGSGTRKLFGRKSWKRRYFVLDVGTGGVVRRCAALRSRHCASDCHCGTVAPPRSGTRKLFGRKSWKRRYFVLDVGTGGVVRRCAHVTVTRRRCGTVAPPRCLW